MEWTHYQPVRIYTGSLQKQLRKALQQLLTEQQQPVKLLLLTSAGFSRRGLTKQLGAWLAPHKVIVIDEVTANPDLDQVDQWLCQLAGQQITAVIGLGGGSVMDAAKAMAVLQPVAASHHAVLDSLFRQQNSSQPTSRLPLLLIPTTAGTGSEVTPFATLWDGRHKQKYSLSGAAVAPDAALLDANLTLSLPVDETLYSGLDTLSHSLESLWNRQRSPLSEAYARQAIELLNCNFITALTQPEKLTAREAMQSASLLAGLAISITRTAIAHSISYPLTSHYGLPHGVACSFTLPALIEQVQQSGLLPELSSSFNTAQQLLQQLPLQSVLAARVSFNQIQAHKAEMFHPDRAGNFILPFDATALQQLLERSEQLLKIAKVQPELTAAILRQKVAHS